MAGCRDRILRALEELSAAELRRLKAALNRLPLAAGYGTIPRGRMEGADALDLTDLVVGYYREGYGVRVLAEALRRIQRLDLADGLVGDAGEMAVAGGGGGQRLVVRRAALPRAVPVVDGAKGGADTGSGAGNDLLPPPSPPVQPHAAAATPPTSPPTCPPSRRPSASWPATRLALIQRVRGVAALLDRLEADGVLSAEEVAAVAAGPTPQEQMRRLLATAPAWGRRGHRQFLRAMRCLHPHLMEDLGEEGEDAPEGEYAGDP
ncbi:apoptosis-associated speck-like protein containing a CARD [Harpia harpyja]|uniref:apoptosis-associated speck-like protein containing a CARD n=1 Tax=Harpia harpyja TaxID=202280 RepID=UPI0022B1B454|nr:apoptosis-associated speck-like protein containing a CARD [Harpia harpyja]